MDELQLLEAILEQQEVIVAQNNIRMHHQVAAVLFIIFSIFLAQREA